MRKIKPYEEGKRAAKNDLPKIKNPYRLGYNHLLWEMGWEDYITNNHRKKPDSPNRQIEIGANPYRLKGAYRG